MNSSQEWNMPWLSQDFIQRLTPSGRVLPPMPSTSMAIKSNLSNSWSQSQSQQTPTYSQNLGKSQNFTSESHFWNEIRFSLHAVLSVVRDLPEKLRLLVTSTFKSKSSHDKALGEEVKKILEDKLAQLEKIISLAEKLLENTMENKQVQKCLLFGVNEIEKNVAVHNKTVKNLQENCVHMNESFIKQLMMTRKSCLVRMKQLKSCLEILNSSITSLKFNDFESKILGIKEEVQNLKVAFNCCANSIDSLIFHEKENTSKLDDVYSKLDGMSKEVSLLKSSIDVLHEKSEALNKKLSEFLENSTSMMKHNIRFYGQSDFIYSNRIDPLAKKHQIHSPVARIAPQVQKIQQNKFGNNTSSICSDKDVSVSRPPINKLKSLEHLEVIEFGSRIENSSVLNINRPLKRKIDWGNVVAFPGEVKSKDTRFLKIKNLLQTT